MSDQSDQSDQSQHQSERSDALLDGEGTGEGIELTVGEPNSFEPEDDPEAADPAADDAADPQRNPDPGTLI